MSAMVVAPAAAARQWTNRLGVMVALSELFGALAGVSGALISSLGSGLSTGPVIVLCISAVVLVSILLAPNRGLVWDKLRQGRNRRRLRGESVLLDFYRMSGQHKDALAPHPVAALLAINPQAEAVLERLAERGQLRKAGEGQWALTQNGLAIARDLEEERLNKEAE